MGADLISAAVCHRQSVNPVERLVTTLDWINHMAIKDLGLCTGDAFDEDLDLSDLSKATEQDLESAKQICKNACEGIVGRIQSLDEIDVREWLGWKMYWTGGMSWGDTPTEAFDDFCQFDNLGTIGDILFAMLGFEYPPHAAEPFKIEEEASIHD